MTEKLMDPPADAGTKDESGGAPAASEPPTGGGDGGGSKPPGGSGSDSGRTKGKDKEKASGGLPSKRLLFIAPILYLGVLSVLQFNFSRMHDSLEHIDGKLDGVTTGLATTNRQLGETNRQLRTTNKQLAATNKQLVILGDVKQEMIQFNSKLTNMQRLMKPLPGMAATIELLNDQMTDLNGSIAGLKTDTSALPQTIKDVEAMNKTLGQMSTQFGDTNSSLTDMQTELHDMDTRLHIIPKL